MNTALSTRTQGGASPESAAMKNAAAFGIKYVLKAHRISLASVAREARLDYKKLHDWCNNPHRMEPATQTKIERVLAGKGIPTHELWVLKQEPVRSEKRHLIAARRGLVDSSSCPDTAKPPAPKPYLRLVGRSDPSPAGVATATPAPKPVVEPAKALPSPEEILMLTSREFLSRPECEYWKLKDDPFEEIANPSDIWDGPNQRAVTHMIRRTARLHNILAVIGEVGSGKSTILRRCLSLFDNDRSVTVISPASLDRKRLNEGAIATAICRALAPGEPIPSSLEDRSRRVGTLLELANKSGSHPLMIIEEAHDLPVEAFISCKRVWDSFNLFKLLGIVFVGQGNSLLNARGENPYMKDLGQKLRLPSIRELGQRTRVVHLAPLDAGEIAQYVAWRFAKVGAQAPSVFDPKAFKALAKNKAMAHPLSLGNLCVAAMRRAQMVGETRVGPAHVNAAMK